MPSLTRRPLHQRPRPTARGGWLEFPLGRVGPGSWPRLCLLAAAWQAGHEAYGPFILTSPLENGAGSFRARRDPDAWAIGGLTLQRAMTGFALVAVAGTGLGVAAGYSPATLRLAGPLINRADGRGRRSPGSCWHDLGLAARTPPCGAVHPDLGAAGGVPWCRSRHHHPRPGARPGWPKPSARGRWRRFLTVGIRQTTTKHSSRPSRWHSGTAFKVAVMAELLSQCRRQSAAAAGRCADQTDIAQALAWVTVSVALLIAVEYTLTHPARPRNDRWRRAAQTLGG